MIQSTSNLNGTVRTDSVAPVGSRPATQKSVEHTEALSTESAALLRQALTTYPEIRPEVVQRGRELISGPDYPPKHVIEEIARLIMKSPDASEQE